MANSSAKKFASMGFAVLLCLGVVYLAFAARAREYSPAYHHPATPLEFHLADRVEYAPGTLFGICNNCHSLAAHNANVRVRGFLNVHSQVLDCSVCHFVGTGITLARLDAKKQKSLTGQGKVYAMRGGEVLLGNEQGIAFKTRGPACRECHSRSSGWFDQPGLFDDYKKLVLKELSLLPKIEEAL